MDLPVVIDLGSSTIKAGFAEEDVPRSVFPNIVGSFGNLMNLMT